MTALFRCDNCGKVVEIKGKLQPSPPLGWSIGVMRGGFVHACTTVCMVELTEERAAQVVKEAGKAQIKAAPAGLGR